MELRKILKLWYSGFMVTANYHRIYIWQGYDWSTGEWYSLYRYSAGDYFMRRGGGNLFRVTIKKRSCVPYLEGGYDLVNNGDRSCYLYY